MVARNVIQNFSNAELGYGSSYKVPAVGNLTVSQYNGTALTNQDATSASSIIPMDQYPITPFYLEDSDVNEATALSLAGVWAGEAGMRIAQIMDTYIFAKLKTGSTVATGCGVTGTPITIATDTAILDYVTKFATVMKEANLDSDAYIVVPSFMQVSLSRSLGVLVQNQIINGAIETGRVGTLFGIDIYASNNLPTGVAGGLAALEFGVIGGKRTCAHLVEGLSVYKSGDSETRVATWNQIGQVYGVGVSNAAGVLFGVVKK